MRAGDSVDLFALAALIVGHGAEDRGEDHAGAVNERQRLVHQNGAARLGARHFRREDGERRGGEIESRGGGAESGVKFAARGAAASRGVPASLGAATCN